MDVKRNFAAQNSVGIYINNLGEPVLIENVRISPKTRRIVMIEVAESNEELKKGSTAAAVEYVAQQDYIPVLPTIVHEAVA